MRQPISKVETAQCSVENCKRSPVAHGFCMTHYRRLLRTGKTSGGRREGGIKAAIATKLRLGKDWHSKIGSKGGKVGKDRISKEAKKKPESELEATPIHYEKSEE